MRFVPVKSIGQQATLAVHSARALLVRQRTMVANALRAALSELGIVASQGYEGLCGLMAKLEESSEEVPEMMRGALLMLAKHWQALNADERVLERQIAKAARCDRDAKRLMEVPSVGPIIASTVLAKVPDAKVFRSVRDLPRPRERAGCGLVEGNSRSARAPRLSEGYLRCDGKWSGNRDRNTPHRHRALQRAAMIGIRSAISIRARGQWPLLEAVYMTAPRSFAEAPKSPCREGAVHT